MADRVQPDTQEPADGERLPRQQHPPAQNPPEPHSPEQQPSSIQTDPAPAQYKADFGADFPDGHEIIPTSGKNLLCGFGAVINTMEAMHPSVPRPALEDLMKVFASQEFVEYATDFNLGNTDNFFIEQVAAVLYFWGMTYHDLNLRIGYVVESQQPRLISYPDDSDDKPPTFVWLHHDNVNHFSGMRPKNTVPPTSPPPPSSPPAGGGGGQENGAMSTKATTRQQSDASLVTKTPSDSRHIVINSLAPFAKEGSDHQAFCREMGIAPQDLEKKYRKFWRFSRRDRECEIRAIHGQSYYQMKKAHEYHKYQYW